MKFYQVIYQGNPITNKPWRIMQITITPDGNMQWNIRAEGFNMEAGAIFAMKRIQDSKL